MSPKWQPDCRGLSGLGTEGGWVAGPGRVGTHQLATCRTIGSRRPRVPAGRPTSTTRGHTALPTYQYRCTECDHAFEEFQSFTDDALTLCPVCGGRLRKVFNAVGVVFKGSGFYRTDSRSKETSSTSSASSGTEGSSTKESSSTSGDGSSSSSSSSSGGSDSSTPSTSSSGSAGGSSTSSTTAGSTTGS